MEALSAIARQTPPMQLSRGLRPESEAKLKRKNALMKKLASMCLDRGEAMDDIRMESYAKALEGFPDAAVDAVLHRLADAKIAQYESKIPIKGDLIAMVRDEVKKQDRIGDCELCENSRYVMQRDGAGTGIATRCQCWLDWKRAHPTKGNYILESLGGK